MDITIMKIYSAVSLEQIPLALRHEAEKKIQNALVPHVEKMSAARIQWAPINVFTFTEPPNFITRLH